MDSKRFFVRCDAGDIGPLSEAELGELARQGKLHPSSLVREDLLSNWRRAAYATDIFSLPAAPPQPRRAEDELEVEPPDAEPDPPASISIDVRDPSSPYAPPRTVERARKSNLAGREWAVYSTLGFTLLVRAFDLVNAVLVVVLSSSSVGMDLQLSPELFKAWQTAIVLGFVATAVAVTMWMHRAFRRVRTVVPDLQYKPVSAVLCWFIPFLNLFEPLQAMRELWRASYGGTQWRQVVAPRVISIWWWTWLFSMFATRLLSLLESRLSEDVRFPIAFSTSLAQFVAGVLLLSIVHRIGTAQNELLRVG